MMGSYNKAFRIAQRNMPLFAALIVLLSIGLMVQPVFAKDSSGNLIIVSMGDSYSSGEGNEPFYHQDLPRKEKATDDDWTAHRSVVSWPGRLKFSTLDGTLRDNKDNRNWIFVASSGAQTFNLSGIDAGSHETAESREKIEKQTVGMAYSSGKSDFRQHKFTTVYEGPGTWEILSMLKEIATHDYLKTIGKFEDLSEISIYEVEHDIPYQVHALNLPGNDLVDYVTISIGGNDVGFSDIITKAVMEPSLLEFIGKLGHSTAKISESAAEIGASYKNSSAVEVALDIFFKGIEVKEAFDPEYLLHTQVEDMVQNTLDTFLGVGNERGVLYYRLKNLYKKIYLESGNPDLRVIVLGYPKLLDPAGCGLFFTITEAAAINNGCKMFDSWLSQAIPCMQQEIQSELRRETGDEWNVNIYYTSVLDEFGDTHLANSPFEPWLYPLKTVDYRGNIIEIIDTQDLLGGGGRDFKETIRNQVINKLISAYCMHPNEKGLEAYQRCAQNMVNQVEFSVCGVVTDKDTGNSIPDAKVRIYKSEHEGQQIVQNQESVFEKVWKEISNFFSGLFGYSDNRDYAYAEPDEEDLIAESVTDEDGLFEIWLVPEEYEHCMIEVYAQGYTWYYEPTDATRKIEDKKSHDSYVHIELEEFTIYDLLCGEWISDSLERSDYAPYYLVLYYDGTCDIDLMTDFYWDVDETTLLIEDPFGLGVSFYFGYDVDETTLYLTINGKEYTYTRQ